MPIPFDQAKKKLPKGNRIHTFRSLAVVLHQLGQDHDDDIVLIRYSDFREMVKKEGDRSVRGILIGADWSRADILKAMKTYVIHETGEKAQKMNHGLAIKEDERGGWLFIETKPAPPVKGE